MEIAIARGDGSYRKQMEKVAKTDLLVIDDRGMAELNSEQHQDLLELIEDRHGLRAALIISQLERWHDFIAGGTRADAILDVHNAYKIRMKGASMRKWYAKKDAPAMMEE
jgi:DNA replication protein DnaC